MPDIQTDRSGGLGKILDQRNTELETLRELSGRIQDCPSEEEILQAALDLVLDRLGLTSGWIFWGESRGGTLELAASRGLAEAFLRRARESGIGDCLCKDVFATGRLRVARNTLECPRLPDLLCGSGSLTHACIPLKFERGTLGVLNIATRPGELFTAHELQFLETVGYQVCLAVDKARSARLERLRDAEATALVSLTRAIGGSLDLERVLAAVGAYGQQLLQADRCAIFLADGIGPPRLGFLSGPPMRGLEIGAPVDFAALGSKAFLSALIERRTLVIQDAGADERVNPDLARRWDIGSAVLVPLLAHGRMEGLLAADRARPSIWSREQVDLADALAAHAAVAIENARLYREAQEAVVRLQAAQHGMVRAERLAAVGTLASSLAHEVRNPLNSIGLQLVLLSRHAARLADSDPQIAALVERARQEIDRLDGLVGEFLSLSTIDRVRMAAHDVLPIVREVLGLFVPVARQKRIALVERGAPDPARVLVDLEKIKQVLINLVRNAIDATPAGGTITMSTQATGESVMIEIADTGAGIEEGLDVFDFFTTTKRGGTGLGLPIARRIVEAHGGRLSFESRPGGGTIFRLTLNVPAREDAGRGQGAAP